ncbi:phosphotransferase enzyme family protein [Eremomyces bilateralis CBS 781.70]|uniref:protein-ribulosamine 3-kinase n=1 Tax=Eremomyces bilateralis CBS 781.70 TaxID=1392243 RepID=A0A6G1FYT2_9PEZI|nr:phosphotransferase enzyme family protein [Eremomyces bilateralis CBS 781.70]KAF1810944.1 phosphotransferase enzyme family protein [Eremomyces bilateralis CBS 781.70]
MKLDPAIAEGLGVDPAHTTLSSAGGGGCSSASNAKITTTFSDGRTRSWFMKSAQGSKGRAMLEGEHASLLALSTASPTLVPRPHALGTLSSSPTTHFLLTSFLTLSSAPRSPATPSLATKLARLHSTPAPNPPRFGFSRPTYCGDTAQDNAWDPSWESFFRERRLGAILRACEENNGADAELRALVERTQREVCGRLIGDGHLNGGEGVVPVVVHGDLWSGNWGRGRVERGEGGKGEFEEGEVHEVAYDPSAAYAHGEFDHGIMKMFGGFGAGFWEEYWAVVEKTEPVEEYEDRVELYELYHHLNHNALFGGSYRSGAVSIMKKLLRKYGKKEMI